MTTQKTRVFLILMALALSALAATHSAKAACDTLDPGQPAPPGWFE